MDNTQISLTHQLPVALVWVYILDYLKKAAWFPWLTQHTEALNRVASVAFALASAVGIKFAVSGSMTAGGSLSIAFPPVAILLDTAMHAGSGFALQEILHKMFGNHLMNKQMLDQISALSEKFNPPVDPVDLPAVPLSASAPAAPVVKSNKQ